MSNNTETTEAPPAPPEPVIDAANEEYWAGLAVGEIRVSSCDSCGTSTLRVERCVSCGSGERHWRAATPSGSIKSFVIFHRGYHAYWGTQVPYNVAVVTMTDGPELLTNVVDSELDASRVGDPVRLEIRKRGEHPAVVALLG